MGLLNNRTMAFTIEGLALRILIFSGSKIESWYNVPLEPDWVREGVISVPEEVGKVMAEAIQEKDVPCRGVLCALASSGSTPQVLNLPRMKKGNMEGMVVRELRKLMQSSGDTDYIYWQPLPGKGTQQEIYALSVPKRNVLNLVEACRTAGITIKAIELRPFTLVRAVNCKNGIIVHGEVDCIEVVIIDNFFPVLFRSLQVEDGASGSEVAFRHILREIPLTIDYYNHLHGESPLSSDTVIYLSGELALDPELALAMIDVVGREVSSVEPPVDCPADFPMAQYMTNIGLMLKGKR